jgi:hypothetical protein
VTDTVTHDDKQLSLERQKAKHQKNAPTPSSQWATGEATFGEVSFSVKNRLVDIEPLKSWAIQNLPREHPLRKLLVAERSKLTPQEYLAKLECWLCLLRK